MTIISPLPYTLANGNPGDASQVMANFNQIVADVNQNAQSAGAAFTNFVQSVPNQNLGLGSGTLVALTSGVANTAIGVGAGPLITSGSSNTCIGPDSGNLLDTGDFNTCVGANSGLSLTSGAQNICIGASSGANIQTGTNNVCIGYNTGSFLDSGSNNIFIGAGTVARDVASANVTSLNSAIANQPDNSWSIGPAGTIQYIAVGSNAAMGVATLSGGTKTVTNSNVKAGSRIFLSRQTLGGTPGHLSITRIAGTSFTINSTSGSETSTVAWEIKENA